MIILVILIAAILRFWQITSVPAALDWDEVSNAYNGYSILSTGQDEFASSFPILFRAYDGWVPPVLIYLNSISTGIFGLSEFAVRFPNAILATLSILGVYLLVGRVSSDKKLALLSSLFLAISPWHIFYSRINVFPTTPIFFVVLATYFFLVGLEKIRFFYLAIIFFVLAIFSYFSAYVFVPLFALTLVFIFRKKLNAVRLVSLLLPIFLSAFLILFVISGGQNRLRGISTFADPDLVKRSSELAQDEGFLGRVFHNRRLDYLQKSLEGYFVNFRFDFLFGKGDAVERMIVPGPGFGLLYLWDLPFLVGGLVYLVTKRPRGWQIFISWLILAPIAAAFALPQPASTRTTLMMPALQIITAWGFWVFVKARTKLVAGILILGLAANFLLFSHQYFLHFAGEKSAVWFYGWRQLFAYLNSDSNKNKTVHFVFRQHENLDQVHMFLLFYNKIDPLTWLGNGGTRLGCGGTTGQFSFSRYDFVPYGCLTKPVNFESYLAEDLVVTSTKLVELPVFEVFNLDGSRAFYVYEYQLFLSLTKNPLTVLVAK